MLAYLILQVLKGFLYLLPHKIVLHIGKTLGYIAYLLLVSKRKIVEDNLRLSDFGEDFSLKQIRALTKDMFINLGITLVEVLLLSKFKSQWKHFFCFEEKHIREFKKATRDGAIVLVSHFNNWEILGLLTVQVGGKRVLGVGQKIKNKYIDSWVKKHRKSMGLNLASKKSFIKESLRCLRGSGIVGFLADQNAGRHGVPMKFLGRQASTFTTPAVLSVKTGKPIYVFFDIRDNNTGNHSLCIEKLEFPDESLENKEKIKIISRRCLDSLEEKIREYPDRWLWIHRRWKK